MEKFTTQFKKTEKNDRSLLSFSRKWQYLPFQQGPVIKKKPPFSNARALITHKIMHSRVAQCNTGAKGLIILVLPNSLFQKVAFWRPLTVKWSPSPDFRQNFGRQKFFPLAVATKMVATWSLQLIERKRQIVKLANASWINIYFMLDCANFATLGLLLMASSSVALVHQLGGTINICIGNHTVSSSIWN